MIGVTLKNYVVEELLGRGGMGVVYRARDTRLSRRVALKVLPPELVRDESRRRRFLTEARAAAAVNHPAIVPIYEIEEEGDVTFIVMELVEGSTVRQLVARGELDLPSALEVAIQVAEALARAHRSGVVHRDIKAENIMVTRDGHPKILDFGLAKLLESSREGEISGGSHVETLARTQLGAIMGTVSYMSPEQARGLPVDLRSDVFSFGVVLYEMVTGKLPFEGQSALDTMHAIAFGATQPVTAVRPSLPYPLERVLERCLQKRPDDRYQDMRDAASDLRAVKRQIESGAAPGVPVLERARRYLTGFSGRGLIWVGVAGAAFGGLLIALLLGSDVDNVFPPLLILLAVGAVMFRRFRNRGQREVRRFVKKASGLKEVRLVTFAKGEFTVVADRPTPRTYLKLNALLSSANERLYRGEPMTLVVREDLAADEVRRLLSSPGVRYVRQDVLDGGAPSAKR